jgi:predicted deacetylase
MSAKYIIRLDDASEYMNHKKWDPYFRLFDKYNIKPIIGVIPFNKDPKMQNSFPDNHFWDRVRTWEKKGYCIAMHGFNHLYESSNGGLLNTNLYSEFAGLPINQQRDKLLKAQEIFNSNSLQPKIFFAPGHTFDKNTIQSLKDVTLINIISDGHALKAFKEFGINWIPQQLWSPQKKLFGLWTICVHPETCTEDYYLKLEDFISRNKSSFERIENLSFKSLDIRDYVYRYKLQLINSFKRRIKILLPGFFKR